MSQQVLGRNSHKKRLPEKDQQGAHGQGRHRHHDSLRRGYSPALQAGQHHSHEQQVEKTQVLPDGFQSGVQAEDDDGAGQGHRQRRQLPGAPTDYQHRQGRQDADHQVDQGINLGPQEPYKEGDQAEEPNDETPAHGLPLTPALT